MSEKNCEFCGGGFNAAGVCRNCGSPNHDGLPAQEVPPVEAVVSDAFQDIVELRPGGEPEAVAAGFRALIVAAGDDPDRRELAESPLLAARCAVALTIGYESDVAAIFGSPPSPLTVDVSPERATLALDLPIRMVCERCLMPVFGTVKMLCKPRHRHIDGGHLARLVGTLSARLQNEAQLAEQVASAVVDLGGGTWARIEVATRRPCDECGAGRALTTARARRTEPAGGDTPQAGM